MTETLHNFAAGLHQRLLDSQLDTEGRRWLDVPTRFRHPSGQLRMDAPYSHRDFGEPQWPDPLGGLR